eukprot:TRINITY_DN75016_c0_g1_i1.p1 TRINITY_DN75016_c0_g1~~TRINITY_DN75016_c0_g1_i1.p1  ORF type:complete len:383 (-),score=54.83 TRINITY_DN75016_c0_g1_i1:89-1237(-)
MEFRRVLLRSICDSIVRNPFDCGRSYLLPMRLLPVVLAGAATCVESLLLLDKEVTFDDVSAAQEPNWPYQAGVMQWREDAPWLPKSPPGPECNSDADCQIDSNVNWRCKQTLGLVANERNTCRTPGRSARENVTCACVTIPCSSVANYPKDASKPQYLMIGDCMTNMILKRLAPVVDAFGWELTHVPGNAASSNKGAHCMKNWLQNDGRVDIYPPHLVINRSWDVITFNFGMHDISHHSEGLTLAAYKHSMSNIISQLVAEQKRSGTKVLWVNNPPVVDGEPEDFECGNTPAWKCKIPVRYNKDVVAYNNAAAELIKKANAAGADIATVDLYGRLLDLCGGKPYKLCLKYQLKYDAHLTKLGLDEVFETYSSALTALHKVGV